MSIAREGYPLIILCGALTLVAFVIGWGLAGTLLALLTVAVTGFFRDPERVIPPGDNLVVSPADGKVVSIAELKGDPMLSDAALRVSIFLSPLDVHINRMPVAGKVEEIRYQPGKFLAAYKQEASRSNEQNALKIIDQKGRHLEVVQIAGVVARRIICQVKRGQVLARGDRFGLIMFGSRTDTYLPAGCRLEVKEGQRVKGGETILGRFL